MGYPGRSYSEIEALAKSRQRSGVPMAEIEEVVVYMYNEEDSEDLMRRLNYAAKSSEDIHGDRLPEGHLSMKDLMQNLLSDFVAIFRQIDTKGEGFLEYQQLEEL